MKIRALAVLAACLLCACGGGGDGGGGNYACSYESRHTGCGDSVWTDWEAACVSINSDDYVITPQEVCDNLTAGGEFCDAGCCIDTEFRNVEFTSGDCS